MDRPGVEVLSFRYAGSSKVSSKKLSERAHLLSIKSNNSMKSWRGKVLAAKENAMGQQDGMRLNLTLSRPTAVVKSWRRESALSPSPNAASAAKGQRERYGFTKRDTKLPEVTSRVDNRSHP